MAGGEQVPETQYAAVGDDRIAYQVFGEGDMDLLWVPASADCIDLRWDWPPYERFLRWLGARARVISFDRRGTGASDRPSGDNLPLWERWADDARAVLDTVGSERAVICGVADSGAAAILFVASDPSRCGGLILVNSQAFGNTGPDDEESRIGMDDPLFAQVLRDARERQTCPDSFGQILSSGIQSFVTGGREIPGCTCLQAKLPR